MDNEEPDEVTLRTRPRVHITRPALTAIEEHRLKYAFDVSPEALHLLTARSAIAFIDAHKDHPWFSKHRRHMFCPFEVEGLPDKQQLWLVFHRYSHRIFVGAEPTMHLPDDYHVERVITEASSGL